MKAAIEHGPSTRYPAFGDGRVSKWTAEGMMARIWLFYTGFYGKNELPLAEGGSISKSQVVTWLEDCINNSGYGLIDELGGMPEAIAKARSLCGNDEAEVFRATRSASEFLEALLSARGKATLRVEGLPATAATLKPGVMYYIMPEAI